MFLVFGGLEEELSIKCYTDAGFQTDRDDSRSQSGYVFVMNGGAVDWKSSKQSVVTLSSSESEYIAASEAGQEAMWIKKFISDLGVVPSIDGPLPIYCDNSAAITLAREPRSQRGLRHIERKFHYIREIIEKGGVEILKVHTDDNLADPFTKALS